MLGNNNSAIYLTISNGKICRQFKTANEHTTSRINKNGKEVHEQFFDYVEGYIKNVTAENTDYGKMWKVEIEKDGVRAYLQFNYSSGYSNGFLMAFPNLDLNQLVKISPSAKKEGDKTKTTLFLNQNGEGLKWAWNKDNPGGLPQMKKIKVKGVETWDDTERMEYLEQMVKDRMLQHFGAKHQAAPVASAPEVDEEAPF